MTKTFMTATVRKSSVKNNLICLLKEPKTVIRIHVGGWRR